MTHGLLYRVRRAARQIGEQHTHLHEILRSLTAAIEEERPEEVRELFVRYRGAIDAHFSLEESVFFPALRGLHPSHAQDLEALGAEHAIFHEQIGRVGDLLDSDFPRFNEALKSLVHDLAVHESREERLVRQLSSHSRYL